MKMSEIPAGWGSQRLYDHPEPPTAERIDLEEGPEFPTQLPPTLDKLINGVDTMPNEDPWLVGADEDEPPQPVKAPKAKKERREKAKKSRNHREIMSILLDIAGMMALSAGFWLIKPWCGLIALGLCLIIMGVAISRKPSDGEQ